MFNKHNHLNRIIVGALFFACSLTLHATDRITFSSGVDYSVGNYSAASATEIWYIPFTLKLEQPTVIYKLTVPFIRITGPGYVTGADADPLGSTDSTNTTESGMGDILTSASYALIPYQTGKPSIDITAKIKLPTADESRGLGTGETDYYLQLDGLYSTGKLTTFATLGYKIYGDPPGIDYRNVFYVSLGTSYPISTTLSGGFMYDYRQSATATGAAVSEGLAFTSLSLNRKNKLLVYLVKGFSESSPDWGVGINLSYLM